MNFSALDLWFPEINLPLRTHWDPLFKTLAQLAGWPLEFDLYGIFQLLIFVGGAIVLLRAAQLTWTGAILGTAALVATLIRVFGDPLTVLGIHWFPFLIFSMFFCRCLPSPVSALLLLLSGFLWSVSAGPLAALGILLAVPLGCQLCQRHQTPRSSALFFLIAAGLLTVNLLFVSIFPLPEYPPGARLAELSSLSLQSFPWIGSALTPNPLRVDFHHALFPLQSLREVIPGLGLVPYFWFSAPLLICAVVFLCAGFKKNGDKIAIGFLVLVVLGGRAYLGAPLVTELLQPDDLRAKLSSQITASVGDWALDDQTIQRQQKSVEILTPDLFSGATAGVNSAAAALAIDGDMNTRWSTGRPQQIGDKFILELRKPTNLTGVLLRLGTHASDFPRGIRIAGAGVDGKFFEIASYPRWDGALYWTETGFPYFSAQSEVRLRFPERQEVKKLEFELLQGDSHFDWAIAEIKLFN